MAKKRFNKLEEKTDYKQIIDVETGEIKEEKIDTHRTLTTFTQCSDDFAKWFGGETISDLLKIMNVGGKAYGVLLGLIKGMTYNNIVTINKPVRAFLSQGLNISEKSLQREITKLKKEGFIIPVCIGETPIKGCYQINPTIAAKGTWQHITEMRLAIRYNEEGKYISIATTDESGNMCVLPEFKA